MSETIEPSGSSVDRTLDVGVTEQTEQRRIESKVSVNEDPLINPDKDMTSEALENAERTWIERIGGSRLINTDTLSQKYDSLKDDPRYKACVEVSSLRYLENQDTDFFHRRFSGEVTDTGYLVDNLGKETPFLPSQNIGSQITEVSETAEQDFRRLYPDISKEYDEVASRNVSEAKTEEKIPIEDRIIETTSALNRAKEEYMSLWRAGKKAEADEIEKRIVELEEEQQNLLLERDRSSIEKEPNSTEINTSSVDSESEEGKEDQLDSSTAKDQESEENQEINEVEELKIQVEKLQSQVKELVEINTKLAMALDEQDPSRRRELIKSAMALLAIIAVEVGLGTIGLSKETVKGE